MILIAIYAVIGLGFLGLLYCILILVRNEWVYSVRIRVLQEQGYEAHERLPSYDYMMRHFWVWDVKMFYRDDEEVG